MFRQYGVIFREEYAVRTGHAQQALQHIDCIYGNHTDRLRKSCNNNVFTPFYFTLDNFNILKVLLI